jgi:hypothetical protein
MISRLIGLNVHLLYGKGLISCCEFDRSNNKMTVSPRCHVTLCHLTSILPLDADE